MMSDPPSAKRSRLEYGLRIHRAVDHIISNLSQPTALDDLARIAHFSPFHFHRIFKARLGQTPHDFAKRLRLEKALHLMSHAPKRTLTDIALSCGFSSVSDFSHSFKQRYGSAPRSFDLEAFRAKQEKEIEQFMIGEGPMSTDIAPAPNHNPDGFEARIRDLPAKTVAYRRVMNPYRKGVVQAASEQHIRWAAEHGVANAQWLGYMWDEPEITGLANCRYDVAVVVDGKPRARDMNYLAFPSMRVAEVTIKGDLAHEARAIDWLYKTWLPESGHVPDDQPLFEAWSGLPYAHGDAHFELAIQLSVRPA